jgi:hypothetical protein
MLKKIRGAPEDTPQDQIEATRARVLAELKKRGKHEQGAAP